jgi:hypothetical protein
MVLLYHIHFTKFDRFIFCKFLYNSFFMKKPVYLTFANRIAKMIDDGMFKLEINTIIKNLHTKKIEYKNNIASL